jgi:hypothetical protein
LTIIAIFVACSKSLLSNKTLQSVIISFYCSKDILKGLANEEISSDFCFGVFANNKFPICKRYICVRDDVLQIVYFLLFCALLQIVYFSPPKK